MEKEHFSFLARILRSSSAIWISNSGNWMAFMKLNDSKICSISYPDLETGSEEEKQEGLRYAKVYFDYAC